ncbi:MAG: SPOR domain-containing protein [Flavobacteriales bacterium]|jgi:hypothetical protein|nr:SPOR domain-containing protein [Flavobacteriales bacterium]
MGLERDLHDLLFCHDCVIVPQWGGFLTHYRPARLDEARKLIHPPSKDLSFNRHLVRNDGLLADRLAKREGLAFDKATARIDAEVAEWRLALDRSGRLELPSIGIFYRDAEHNLQFDPDRRTNYLRDAYGLRPLAAVAVEPVRTKPAALPITKPQPAPEEIEDRKRPYLAWAAASAGILLIGAAAFWVVSNGPDGQAQWSGWAPWKSGPEPSYTAPAQAGFAPVNALAPFTLDTAGAGVREVVLDEESDVRMKVDWGRPVAALAAADTTHVALKPTTTDDSALRYHVVGGCFAQPENADKLLSELLSKGFPARRLRQRGQLHPVAIGSYASRDEAMAMLKAVRTNEGRSAWLLVR